MIATAPGKLILTGEYAVLDGAPAIVVAVNRRVAARRTLLAGDRSPFLAAVADELARRDGPEDPATRAARMIEVDSSAFYDGATKLGLGSSAAVTVAATVLALGVADRLATDRELVRTIAAAAHAAAQGARGARGSGADIAAAVYGGTIAFTRDAPIARRHWPARVRLVTFFTGVAADTATLVAGVETARADQPAAVEAALVAIGEASRAACAALAMRDAELAGAAFLAALQLDALAIDRLAHATGLALVPACVTAARARLRPLGGTAKTTGAGGGDVGIAVIPATIDETEVTRILIECGCQPLPLTVDEQGVDLRSDAQ